MMYDNNHLRRHYTRFKMDAPVVMVAGGVTSTVLVTDVSARGFRGILERPLEIKQDVRISFQLPVVRQPVTANARVVWARTLDNNAHAVGFSVNHLALDNFAHGLLQQSVIALEPAVTAIDRATGPLPSLPRQEKDVAARPRRMTRYLFLVVVIACAIVIWLTPSRTLGSLDGIMFDPSAQSYAVINGVVVKEGQTFKNMIVKSITRDSVVLTSGAGNGHERTLLLRKKRK